MAHAHRRHATSIAAALVVVVFVVACFGLAPSAPALSTGSAQGGSQFGERLLSEPALAISSRSGAGGLVAVIVFGGSAVGAVLRVASPRTATLHAPIEWRQLAAGLVPLPLRI